MSETIASDLHASDSSSRLVRNRWIMLGLIVLTMGVFWPVGRFEFINYDDPKYITDNADVVDGLTWQSFTRSFTSKEGGYRHPVTWWTHLLDVSLYGHRIENGGGHHVTSLLFHVANTVLLFWVLARLTGATWPAAWTAAMFAVHPMHLESVAWVSERKDVVSGLFLLLTVWAYVVYTEKRSVARYLLVVLAFTMALMSKPMMVTTPVLLLLLDIWPLRRLRFAARHAAGSSAGISASPAENGVAGRRVWWCIGEKIPLLFLSLISGLVTIYDTSSIGSFAGTEMYPIGFRIKTMLVSYVRYLGKLAWPTDLAIFYPYPADAWRWSWVIGSTALLIVISALVVWQARKRSYLLFGWLWFLISLLPVIGLLISGDLALADRYTYVPYIGLFVAIAWLGRELAKKLRVPSVAGGVGAITVAACVAVSAVGVWRWKDSFAIMGHAMAVTENNWTAILNYGLELRRRGRHEEACGYFHEALRVRPGSSRAMTNVAWCLIEAGKLDEAEPLIMACQKLEPDNPNVWTLAGNWRAVRGQHLAAIQRYQKSLELKPRNEDAERLTAYSYLALNRLDDAERHLNNALRINPTLAHVHHRLALIHSRWRQPEKAIEAFENALSLDPRLGLAHADYGALLAQLGRRQEAIEQLQLALETLPEKDVATRSLAETNIGRLLEMAGRQLEAAEHYLRAVQLAETGVAARPNDATAHFHLAATLGQIGQDDRARAAAIKSLELATQVNNLALIEQLRRQFGDLSTTQPSTQPATRPG